MGDWTDAHPEEVCACCGFRLREHAPVHGYAWLTRLCDGELVRLR